MKIAVTGGTGYIGSRLRETCLKQNGEYLLLTRRALEVQERHLVTNFNNRKETCAALKDVDVVINLMYDFRAMASNIKHLNNLLYACLQADVKKIIHMSTINSYDLTHNGILDENTPKTKIYDLYSGIKLKQEILVKSFCEKHKIEFVILQPAIVIGNNDGSWVNKAKSIANDATLFLPNGGNALCNTTHVDKVCRYIVDSLDIDNSNFRNTEVLITDNANTTWNEFYKNNVPSSQLTFKATKSKNLFHDSIIKDALYALTFSKLFFEVFMLLSPLLEYRLRKKNQNTTTESKAKSYNPIGINRVIHNCHFIVKSLRE